jgi:hypothetical protein
MSAAIDDVLALVRPDLQAFAGYSSARSAAVQGEVWLNANDRPGPIRPMPQAAAGAIRSRSRWRCARDWRRCTA